MQVFLPISRHDPMRKFYSESIDIVPELRLDLYKYIASRLINFDQLVQMVTNVKWDAPALGVEYSPYVDFIGKEFKTFSQRIAAVSKTGCLPQIVLETLFDYNIKRMMEMLVEGYSRMKKCSSDGLAMMNLDFNVITMELEKLIPVRPIPHANFVGDYIKAFYLTQVDILPWIRQNHVSYTRKQLVTIVTMGLEGLKKKQRDELITIIDELKNEKKSGNENKMQSVMSSLRQSSPSLASIKSLGSSKLVNLEPQDKNNEK